MSRPARAGLPPIRQWRQATARLVTLLHADRPCPALAAEAFALQRQCEHLATDLQALAERTRAGRAEPQCITSRRA